MLASAGGVNGRSLQDRSPQDRSISDRWGAADGAMPANALPPGSTGRSLSAGPFRLETQHDAFAAPRRPMATALGAQDDRGAAPNLPHGRGEGEAAPDNINARHRLVTQQAGGHTDQGMTAARINLILLDSLQHRLTPDDRNTPYFRHCGEDGPDVGNR